MNFVDFVVDFCSHITSHVSQAFASYTHNTSYSLLNFVHIIVCACGLTNHVLKKTLSFMQNYFCCFKTGEDCLKSKFLENWVSNLCFGRAFHLILMHFFFCYIQCFEVRFQKKKNKVFFPQKLFFPEFRLIQSNFRSIKILL